MALGETKPTSYKQGLENEDSVLGYHPAILFDTSISDRETHPTVRLDGGFIPKFHKSECLVQEVEKTKEHLREREGTLKRCHTTLSLQVMRAKGQMDSARRAIYKRARGQAREEKKELMRRGKIYNMAVEEERTLRRAVDELENDVRKAEQRHYNYFKDFQDLFIKTCAHAGISCASKTVFQNVTPPDSITLRTDREGSKVPRRPEPNPKVDLAAQVSQDTYSQDSNAEPESEPEVERDVVGEQMDAMVKAGEGKGSKKDVLASEFGTVSIKRDRDFFRELGRAEEAYYVAEQTAKDAGIPLDSDGESDNKSDFPNTIDKRATMRKSSENDSKDYNPCGVLEWLEDPERPAKRNRRAVPNKDETLQLF
ncbi:hypothetical protein G6011_05474 [Alternaria panax]|uniref:Uncharacterized protein n=1 Tax=Alternaria panax TaxID=48097 RepID=A0AAD4I6J1_9PLEO|nr:hypothetical protein G6011_05474 [Alternaria panax]